MKNRAYEKAYWDARDTLYRRGKQIGKPTPGQDGIRRCKVNGIAFTDRELFLEAWGEALAQEIIREEECDELSRLWHEYSNVTANYMKIFAEQQKYSAVVNLLTPALKQLSERRQQLRQCLRRSEMAHESQAA